MSPEEFVLNFKEKHGETYTKDNQLIRDMNDKELLQRILKRYPGERSTIVGLDKYLSEGEQAQLPPQSKKQQSLAEGYKRLSESVGKRVAAGWMGAAAKAKESVERGAEKFAAAGDGSSVQGQVERTGALLETGLGTASAAVQAIFAPVTALVEEGLDQSGASDAIAQNPHVQQLAQWAKEHPDQARIIGDAFNVATAGGSQKIGGPALDAGLGKAGGQVVETALDAGAAATEAVGDAARSTARFGKNLAQGPRDVIEKARLDLSKSNLDPRTTESAMRLQEKGGMEGVGAAKRPDLVKKYDGYFAQEQKFKGDIKEDTALGMVGEGIGDAFDKVVKLRRAVGQTMGDELKKVGTVVTDIAEPYQRFFKTLEEQGVVYDSENGIRPIGKQNPFTKEDQEILESYVKDLDNLSTSPTVAELDAFMKRVPDELDVAKAAKNITKVTNGERIIKQHLSQLREQFNPEVTKRPELTAYYGARKAYSELSDFVEEGITFLGKKRSQGTMRVTHRSRSLRSNRSSILARRIGSSSWRTSLTSPRLTKPFSPSRR